jgi:hypothetical protein
MSRSNDVGAPCFNETWGSSSMSGWLFEAVDTPGFGTRNLECWEFSCGVHLPAPVTIDPFMANRWVQSAGFGNGRKLHFSMKDVYCLSFRLLKKYLAGTE